MEVIGPVFRQWASKIAALLQYQSARRIKEGIEAGDYSLGIEGQQVKIMPNMVSFMETVPKGVLSEEFSGGLIYLDTEITDEIRSEGFAKEMIRRIQEMRKEMNLEVDEEIHTKIKISDELYDILEGQKDFIARETRSQNLDFISEELTEGYIVEWNAEGESFTISIVTERAIAEMEARKKQEEMPVNLCGLCGNPLNYIEEYSRWYCYECKKYAQEEDEEEEVVEGAPQEYCSLCGTLVPEDAVVCAKCGAPLVEEIYEEEGAEEYQEPAEAAEGPDIEKLTWGGTHLIKSEATDKQYKLIEQAIEKGHPAICFTRDFPKKLKDEFNFGETRVYWLSNIGKKDTIKPKNLEKLSLSMEQFLSKDEGGLILLSGIEYLITNNSFLTVLRLIQSLRDQVAVSNSILIIPVNPSTLEGSQLKLLEREVDVIL
jgi:isoleucyl-tRNA synthetase